MVKRDKLKDENCLSCQLRLTTLFWGLWLGISFMSCQHHDSVRRPQFRSNKYHMTLSVLLNLLPIYGLFINIYGLQFDTDFFLKLRKIFNILNYCLGISIYWSYVPGNRSVSRAFNGYLKMCSQKKIYGINPKFSKRYLRTIKLLEYFIIPLYFYFLIRIFIHVYFKKEFVELVDSFATIVVFNVGISFIDVTTMLCTIFEEEHRSFSKGLVKVLNRRTRQSGISSKPKKDKDFLMDLKFLRRYYFAIMMTVKEFLQPVNMWFACGLFIFAVITSLHQIIFLPYVVRSSVKNLQSIELLDGVLELILIYMQTIIVCVRFGNFHNYDDEVYSFIFKYPISKLNVDEAFEVQMLFNNLLMKKADFRVSDIFTLNQSLLVTISAHSITYMLTTLSFFQSSKISFM